MDKNDTCINMIRQKWQMYIFTLYKQKGSWKELESYMGIFILDNL